MYQHLFIFLSCYRSIGFLFVSRLGFCRNEDVAFPTVNVGFILKSQPYPTTSPHLGLSCSIVHGPSELALSPPADSSTPMSAAPSSLPTGLWLPGLCTCCPHPRGFPSQLHGSLSPSGFCLDPPFWSKEHFLDTPEKQPPVTTGSCPSTTSLCSTYHPGQVHSVCGQLHVVGPLTPKHQL